MKKNVLNTPDEELLDIIKNSKEEINVQNDEDLDDIKTFLHKFNLIPGENQVPRWVLHKLYKATSKKPASKFRFTIVLDVLFQKIRYNETNYAYLINKDELAVTSEYLNHFNPKTPTKLKTPINKRFFENFLNHFNLKPGNVWIEGFVLRYLYDKWNYDIKSKTRINISDFNKFLVLYFKSKRVKYIPWFRVSSNINKLITEEQLKQIREGRSFNRAKKRKKELKRKKRESQA